MSCGDGPGGGPQKGMARKSVSSVDSRSGHPQMAPIAGPFPPRPGFSPTEARRCADRRAATGQGEAHNKEWPGNRCHLWTADLVIHRWHGLPAHSRRGLVFPRQRPVAVQNVVRRRVRAMPTKRNGPEIGGICGQQIWSSTDGTDCRPIPAAAWFFPDRDPSLRRMSCGDGPGGGPQKGMARKSVSSVDSKTRCGGSRKNSLGPSLYRCSVQTSPVSKLFLAVGCAPGEPGRHQVGSGDACRLCGAGWNPSPS
jgi:hypothetical protein